MGPKLMSCCKPERVGTNEHGQMLKRILEDGRPCQRGKKTGRLKDKRGELLRRNTTDCQMGGFTAQKGLRNLAREKMLQDRGALPKEEGDVVREYKAMYEENFSSSC